MHSRCTLILSIRRASCRNSTSACGSSGSATGAMHHVSVASMSIVLPAFGGMLGPFDAKLTSLHGDANDVILASLQTMLHASCLLECWHSWSAPSCTRSASQSECPRASTSPIQGDASFAGHCWTCNHMSQSTARHGPNMQHAVLLMDEDLRIATGKMVRTLATFWARCTWLCCSWASSTPALCSRRARTSAPSCTASVPLACAS